MNVMEPESLIEGKAVCFVPLLYVPLFFAGPNYRIASISNEQFGPSIWNQMRNTLPSLVLLVALSNLLFDDQISTSNVI